MNKLFAVAAAFFLLSVSTQAQSIRGKVSQTESNQALSDVNVNVLDHPAGTSTDADGTFLLQNLQPGTYRLEFSAVGYTSAQRSVDLLGMEEVYIEVNLRREDLLLNPVNINAVRAQEEAPIAQSNLSEEEIESRDDGRDIPFILQDLPSTVSYSDAGAGVGYTGLRIRGSDITRINVTVNGIPLNDPESHGVFWVNTPDLASSTNSLQVQRGVGTSTNGAGAFGASINMKTSDLKEEPYARTELGGGSFNTLKQNIQVGSGLLNDHWAVEARLSNIQSDGFIDRARSSLQSYYLSGSYYSKNTSVQLIHFAGSEETYQAWWGIPEEKLYGTQNELFNHIARNGYGPKDSANLVNADPRQYNYYTYDQEVDNYRQDHWQLHLSHRFSEHLKANIAGHYTWGRGYFEQFRPEDDFSDYGLEPLIFGPDTITNTDLIRRRWLNNYFAGATFSFNYQDENIAVTYGGAANRYYGGHYGEIIWARYASNSDIRDRYYDNQSLKTDLNQYLKVQYKWGQWDFFGDLQFRSIFYSGEGIDNDQFVIDFDNEFNFINPKFGFNYSIDRAQRIYASVSKGSREPVRTDFLDAIGTEVPTPETMIDYEAGYQWQSKSADIQVNAFFMDYQNQLVLTGRVNDVGAAIRENVENSYRAGIELSGNYRFLHWAQVGGNLTLSRNVIQDYTYYIVDYDNGGLSQENLGNTQISFSPGTVASLYLMTEPIENASVKLTSRHVSRQYLDNTASANSGIFWLDEVVDFSTPEERPAKSIDPFSVVDLSLNYHWDSPWFKGVDFYATAANLFDVTYAPNGYTYSYIYGGNTVTENFYYPMASRNYLAGIKVAF